VLSGSAADFPAPVLSGSPADFPARVLSGSPADFPACVLSGSPADFPDGPAAKIQGAVRFRKLPKNLKMPEKNR